MNPDVSSTNDVVSPSTVQMVAQLRGTDSVAAGLTDQISKQLESAITVGLLAPGDKLPPESLFAEQLGVSPITLRQALATLRLQGLIDTRRGRGGGSYIRGQAVLSEAAMHKLILDRSPDDLRDLGDLAATIAAGTGRRAALRADEQDIRRSRELANRCSRATTSAELRRTDSRFHISLGVASQSRRLTNATIQIQGELASLMWHDAGRLDQVNAEHEAILSAVARRDAEAAAELSSLHFERETEMLIDSYLHLATQTSET